MVFPVSHPIPLGVFLLSSTGLWAAGYVRWLRVDYRSYQFILMCVLCLFLNTLNIAYWADGARTIVMPFSTSVWTVRWIWVGAGISAIGLLSCLIWSRESLLWAPAFLLLLWAVTCHTVLLSNHMAVVIGSICAQRASVFWRVWTRPLPGQTFFLLMQIGLAIVGLACCNYEAGSLFFSDIQKTPLSPLLIVGISALHLCIFCELALPFMITLARRMLCERGAPPLLWLFLVALTHNFLGIFALMRIDLGPLHTFWEITRYWLFGGLGGMSIICGAWLLFKERRDFFRTFFDGLIFQTGVLLLLLSLPKSLALWCMVVYLTGVTGSYFVFLWFFSGRLFRPRMAVARGSFSHIAPALQGFSLMKLYFIAGGFPSPFFLLHVFLIGMFLAHDVYGWSMAALTLFIVWSCLWFKKFLSLNVYLFRHGKG